MKAITLAEHQTIGDIISAVQLMHNNQRPNYYAMYASMRPKKNVMIGKLYTIANNIIRYSEEPEQIQTVKTLHAILRDRVGDCKHYASMICGIAEAWGLPACYRFVDYGDGIQHVYALIYGPNGWTPVDPVAKKGPGYEEPFVHSLDYYIAT